MRAVLGTVAEPRWAPGSRDLAWVATNGPSANLVVARADGSVPPVVVSGAHGVAGTRGGTYAWVDADQLAFVGRDGQLRLVGADGRGLVDGPRVRGRAAAPAISSLGGVAFVDETEDACVIVVAPLDADSTPTVVSHADFAWDPDWSPDGTALAWHEWDAPNLPWDGSRIVMAAADGTQPTVIAGADDESVGQPRFAPTGAPRLAFVSDRGGWSILEVVDSGSGTRTALRAESYEHSEPAWGPGQRSYAWSPDGRSIAWCRNEDGFGRLVIASIDADELPADLVKGWHRHLDWGPAGIVATRSGGRTLPSIAVVKPDGSGRRVVATATADPDAPSDPVEPDIVQWGSPSGATISGLRYGADTTDRARPLLVMVHSGPNAQALVDWDERVQHFVARGWTVLAPNYRGSTGYGRAFTQSLAGEWGVADVDDTVAGIRAAVLHGWADPQRVAVIGASAGGFTALLVASAAPDRVRAVVASYPVTDLLALAAHTHRFERHSLDRHVGVLPGAESEYRARSPIARVDAIRAPLLVLAGDADPVVSVSDTSAFVDALRARKADVEYHVYPGAGHGWSDPAIAADARRRTDEFLTRKVLV